MPIRLLGLLVLLTLPLAASCADDTLAAQIIGLNSEAAQKWNDAKKKIDDKKYTDALDDLQALINVSGNDLIPLSTEHSVQIRWLCHRTIATLPPSVLRAYRQRVDAQAQKLLDQAGEPPDERILHRLVEEFFCSRPAEIALHRLGDMAFESGRFSVADRWWQHLLPDEFVAPARLTYPAPEGKPALVQAKILLARWFRNDRSNWKLDLDQFRRKYPNAEGTLGGRTGKLVDLLDKLTVDDRDPVQAARQATTFGGNSNRSVLLPDEPTRPAVLARLSRLGEKREIPLGPVDLGGKVVPVAEAARSLAFHPIIADGQVLVADARYVTGYDLKSGKKEVWFDAETELGKFDAKLDLPATPDLRYTLSAAEDCVLARLGAQEIRADKDAPTCIVCLERTSGKRLRWKATLDTTAGPAYFEGTPVILGRSCYVAVTRFAGGHTITSIHCYPLDVRGTAHPRWTCEICKTRELQNKETRVRHHLLTVAGPNVVYCSHSGAIVALNTDTGRRAWAVRYPSKPDKTGRHLTPCAYANGRLFAAPADLNRLIALDALNGELIWDRDGINVQQILGIAQNRLIFTTLTPRAGLRAVGVLTGTDTFGWFQPGDGGSLPTFGFGMLAGERVYWPAADRVHVLDQASGQVPEDPTQLRGIPPGNIVVGEGCLVVADRKTLYIFTPPSFDLEGQKKRDLLGDGLGLANYRLGVAYRDAGDWKAARSYLGRALKQPDPDAWVQGRPLQEAILDEIIGTHFDAAREAIQLEDWDEAISELKRPAWFAPPSQRAEGIRQLVDVYERCGKTGQAVAALQTVMTDPELEGQLIRDNRRLQQTVRVWAMRRMDALIATHGRAIYAEIEKAAVASLDQPSNRLERLRFLFAAYPHAEVTHKHLLELATTEEKAGHPGQAASAYRHWLQRPLSGEDRARVDTQLARLSEVAVAAATLDVPLSRDWHHDGSKSLVVSRSGQFFCARGGGAFDLQGCPLWTNAVRTQAVWVGQESELALLGSPHELRAVYLRGGAPVWRYPSPATPLSEFAGGAGRVYAVVNQRRLLALDAFTGEVIWQCDAPASFRPRPLPGGRFDKIARVTDRFVFLRLGDGRIWKLDATTGTLLAEEPATGIDKVRYCDAGSGSVRWTHSIEGRSTLNGEPPCLICREGQSLLLVGRNYAHTLQRLDIATGKPIWEREFILGDPTDPRSFSVDEHACYFVHDHQLKAVALADGKLLWHSPLPSEAKTWRSVRAGDVLVVWPCDNAAMRFHYRTAFGSLEWRMERGWEARPNEGLPILLYDAKHGKLVQRLNLPVKPDLAEARLCGWWQSERLTPQAPPQVIVHSGGLTILVGTQAWGFKPMPDGNTKRD